MKYRVYVKEIHVRSYTVEAQSKAHAKNLVTQSRNGQSNAARAEGGARPWGMIGPENWDVDQLS